MSMLYGLIGVVVAALAIIAIRIIMCADTLEKILKEIEKDDDDR